MILYRAIEFSKLQYLLDNQGQLFWILNDLNFGIKDTTNWWMEDDPATVQARHDLISSVVFNSKNQFFNISSEFNSINGGRFNPKQSFGALYTSNHHLVAALEVLYHQFEAAYLTYKIGLKHKASNQTNFNSRTPSIVDLKIVVFEFGSDLTQNNFHHLNESQADLHSVCADHGFERYTGTKFSRDFIFGNDYLISQILGCSVHSRTSSDGIMVPSARIDFNVQDVLEPNVRNFIVPESRLSKCGFNFTNKYIEYHFKINCVHNTDNRHDVTMTCGDIIEKFEIQSFPEKRTDRENQIRVFEHSAPSVGTTSLREVVTQRFK